MNRCIIAVSVALFLTPGVFAQSGDRPQGQAENAWRYVRYNGRWWYWTRGDQWSLYNGRQWITFQPQSIGSSLVGAAKSTSRQPAAGDRGGFYNSLEANTRSILDSTRTLSPPPLGATNPTSRLGASGTPLGAGLEPTRRSGDAGSGVGGGSVGGTNVTSEVGSTPPR